MDRATTQRLWGAAVLIAIAVIFLPMLVKKPAPDSGVRDVPLDIPKAPMQPQSNVQELPLGEPGTLPENGAVSFSDAEADAAQATVAPAAVAAGDYAINYGNYASASDAQKVIAALSNSGLNAYSDAVTASGKTAYRVRVGPYTTREGAEAARIEASRVNPAVKAQVIALNAVTTEPNAAKPSPTKATAVQTAVTSAPAAKATAASVKPAETAPTTAKPADKPASQPVVAETPKPKPVAVKPAEAPKPAVTESAKPAAASTGFAVQLGAFSNAEEAQKLRDRARAAGFSASTETVKTDKGVLTRVKLGPTTTRQSADAMRASAQSKLGVAGVVRSQP